jgi:bacteriocin-like protein
MKEATTMTNDSKSTLHGNKTDQDQLTDDQLQAVSGGETAEQQKEQENAQQQKIIATFNKLVGSLQ